ncbi:flagellar biosynthetic protein FliO [Desulfovibrio sp. OttesenSCG-928-I05]|nr:flagellar biosynthetic protein FliO [Desulfovibrio sp. OttesenSCG-928-I05]
MSAPDTAVSATPLASSASPAAASGVPAPVDVAGSLPASGGAPEAGGALADSASGALGQGFDAIGSAGSVFSWGGYFQAIAFLFVLIGILWLALWYLKRRGGIQKLGIMPRDMSIESRLALGPKKYLVVVRFLNKRLLLGVSDQQITLLTELADDDSEPENTAAATHNASSFRDALRAAEEDAEP